MIEKMSILQGVEEEVLYRRHRNEGNLMLTDFRSPMLEKFFKSMAAGVREPVVKAGEMWMGPLGQHRRYTVPFYPEVPGARWMSETPLIFDRDADAFNLFPLTFVGLGEGITILTEDLIYEAEKKGLYKRFNQVINEFYNRYLRPVDVTITLTVRVEGRAA